VNYNKKPKSKYNKFAHIIGFLFLLTWVYAHVGSLYFDRFRRLCKIRLVDLTESIERTVPTQDIGFLHLCVVIYSILFTCLCLGFPLWEIFYVKNPNNYYANLFYLRSTCSGASTVFLVLLFPSFYMGVTFHLLPRSLGLEDMALPKIFGVLTFFMMQIAFLFCIPSIWLLLGDVEKAYIGLPTINREVYWVSCFLSYLSCSITVHNVLITVALNYRYFLDNPNPFAIFWVVVSMFVGMVYCPAVLSFGIENLQLNFSEFYYNM
jgi:hypothetical protein